MFGELKEEGGGVFLWKFEEFSKLVDQVHGFCATGFSLGGRSWRIIFYPRNRMESRGKMMFLDWSDVEVGDAVLGLLVCGSEPARNVRYSVGIRTANGGSEKRGSGMKTFDGPFSIATVRVIGSSELLRRRNELLPNDTLTLELKVDDGSSETVLKSTSVEATVERNVAGASAQTAVEESESCGGKGEPSEKTESPASFDPNLESLSLDLSKLLEDQVLTDVKLNCAGRTISAHRAVLAARSKVFADRFRNNTVESEIDVTDLDGRVLDLFLKCVYSGKIQGLPEDLVPGVYAACNKYAVHSLKKACSDRMIAGLAEGNCVSFLTVADAHGDAPFKEKVVSFIRGHEAILLSEAWSNFRKNHKELADEVYDSYVRWKSGTSVDSAPSFGGDGADDELAQPKRRKFCR